MNRPFTFSVGEYYHVYNRGVEKRIIFKDDFDRDRFILLLYLCNTPTAVNIRDLLDEHGNRENLFALPRESTLVGIITYCLMPNHFHILVHEKQNQGISMFMKKVGTAYSMFFNRRHGRTGRLFEAPFRAKHVDNEAYLLYLLSYIHLNPVKIIDPTWKEDGVRDADTAKKYLQAYQYSSLPDYLAENRAEMSIVAKEKAPEMLTPFSIDDLIEGWDDKISLYNNVISPKDSPL